MVKEFKEVHGAAVTKAVEEFSKIKDDVTRSDLQGIVDVRAAEIAGNRIYSDCTLDVSEEILRRLDGRL